MQLHPQLTDPFGNQMLAPDGTIPVRRKTLANLARFRTLREFFQKSPSSAVTARPPGGSGSASPQVVNDAPEDLADGVTNNDAARRRNRAQILL